MNDGHLQLGYHGCDVTVRDGLISGRLSPAPSGNQYDWLGPGFYLKAQAALRIMRESTAKCRQRVEADPPLTR